MGIVEPAESGNILISGQGIPQLQAELGGIMLIL